MSILKNIIGSESDRLIKKWRPIVEKINKLEGKLEKLEDPELKLKTVEFKERLKKW